MYQYPYSLLAGQGLGTSYSSLSQIGELISTTGAGQADVRLFANLANGNLVVRDHVCRLVEVNGPLEFYYLYNDQDTSSSKWRFAAGRAKQFKQLPSSGRSAVLIEADGHETLYTYDAASGWYFAPALAKCIPYLRFDNTKKSWLIYYPDTQITEVYDAHGYMRSYYDKEGRETIYEYDASKQISAVVGASGTRYEINRNREQITLTVNNGVTRELLMTWEFANGMLKNTQISNLSVTNAYAIDYGYNVNRLTSITQSDNTNFAFFYVVNKLNRIQMGEQSTTFFNYDKYPFVSVTDSRGSELRFIVDAQARISQIDRPNGYDSATSRVDTTKYIYTIAGQIEKIIHPDQGITEYTYLAPYGLRRSKQKPDGQMTQYFYEENTVYPTLIAIAQQLDGNLLITRNVYDHNYDGKNHCFLRFKISPEGRVTEYIPDLKIGNPKFKKTYLINKFTPKDIQPGQPVSLNEMLAWVAQQDKQQISLTEYVYDKCGQLTQTIAYAEIDKDGNGIDNGNAGQVLTARNKFGSLENLSDKQTTTNFARTVQKFDAMQRKTDLEDPLENHTEYRYLDQDSQIKITYPNEKIELQQFNDCGVQISETLTANELAQSRTTVYTLDNTGNINVITHPDASQTIQFWDLQNRLGYTVSPLGRVVFTSNDAQNHFKIKTAYATLIDPKKIWRGAQPSFSLFMKQLQAMQNPALDRTSYEFFDLSGRLHYTVNAGQYITEYRHDQANRLIGKIIFKERLADTLFNQLQQGHDISLTPNLNKDRWWQYFYDKDGNKIAEQDPVGYVKQYNYDAGNRLFERIHFATKTAHLPNLSEIIPSPTEQDVHTYFYNNPRGKCIIEVDAENYVTTYEYYPNCLKSQSKRYANPLAKEWKSMYDSSIPTLPSPSGEDRITTCEYDLLERHKNTSLPFKMGKKNDYDNMGHNILSEEFDQNDPESVAPDLKRMHSKKYDQFGQCIFESEQKEPEQNAYQNHFDSNGLKLKCVNPMGETTYFYYDVDSRPIIEINAKGAVVETTLNNFNEPEKIRHYEATIPAEQIPTLTGGLITPEFQKLLDGLKNDTQDKITVTIFNKLGQHEKIIDPESRITEYTYDAFNQCELEKLPLNKIASPENPSYFTIKHEYDGRSFETKTSRISADNTLVSTESFEFDNVHGKQTKHIDQLGHVTERKYDRLGQQTRLIDPMQVTREINQHDAFGRLASTCNSLQQITTHEYNQTQRTHTIFPPLSGTQITETANVFGEKIKQEDAAGNLETWQHENTGLVTEYARYISGQWCKIIDEYDLLHRLASHTDANGIKTRYEHNEAGFLTDKIFDINGLKLRTKIEPDSWGRAEIVTDPRNIKTISTFDRNDLLIQELIDPTPENSEGATDTHLNLLKQHTYNEQNEITSTIEGDLSNLNQYEETNLHDSINRTVGKNIDPTGLKLTTRLNLDLANQCIATTDEHDYITRHFYDANGRERFVVDPEGGVIEKQYDTESNVTLKREYKRRLQQTLSDQTTLDEMISYAAQIASSEDSQIRHIYDNNNRECLIFDSRGAVQEKRYNKANQVVSLCCYYEMPKIENYLVLKQYHRIWASLTDHPKNRTTYYVSNAAGKVRFEIDADGYVQEKCYDKNLNLIKEVLFNQQVNDPQAIAQMPEDSIEQVLNVNDPLNQITYTIYDSSNNPMYQVFPEGNVVFYGHDENNNLVEECKFANKLSTIPADYNELVTLLKNNWIPNKANQDRIFVYSYDAKNRKCKVTDPKGNTDVFKMDAIDNICEHTTRNQVVWKFIHDRNKRETQQISPQTNVISVEYDSTIGTTGALIAVPKSYLGIRLKEYDDVENTIVVTEGFGTPEARRVKSYLNKCNKPIRQEILFAEVDNPEQVANFKNRPEVVTTVASEIVYDGKNQPIVTIDEKGKLSFLVYDSENNLVYTVNSKGAVTEKKYNAFKEIEEEIAYKNTLPFDLSLYAKSGLSLAAVKFNLEADLKEDRHTYKNYNKRGKVTSIEKGPVPYYVPNEISPDSPFYGVNKMHEEFRYNAARQCYYHAKLINPKTDSWERKIYWFDRNNNQVAQVDPDQYVIRDKFNAFNQIEDHCEYANKLADVPNPDSSLAELDRLIIPNTEKDRRVINSYDLCGLLSEVRYINADLQKLVFLANNVPSLVNLRKDLTLIYQYSNTEKPVALTYEDGSSEFTYYDNRDLPMATAEIPRANADPNNPVLIPLTYYNVNVFGEQVQTKRFKLGTALAIVNQLPVPIATSPEDQAELVQMNTRGLPRFKQDAEMNLVGFTYTATNEPARTWNQLTNLVTLSPLQEDEIPLTEEEKKEEEIAYQPIHHIDEKRYNHDVPISESASQNPDIISQSCVSLYRDGNSVQKTYQGKNAFNEVIAEGPDGINFPVTWKYDVVGNVWSTNSQKNAFTISCRDLRGMPSATLQSATKNLGDYNNLIEILESNLDIQDLERTEEARSPGGNVLTQMSPAYLEPGDMSPQPVPIAMLVTKKETQNGVETWLDWLLPQERNLNMEFYIWPEQGTAQQKLEIVAVDTDRCGINVSHLATDVYHYKIRYLKTMPDQMEPLELYYTEGLVQFDTNNNKNSTALVVLPITDEEITLSGKTKKILYLELWKDGHRVNVIRSEDNTPLHKLNLDSHTLKLSGYNSGVYTLKPYYADFPTPGPMSLPFTIYTQLPATTPLSQEINFRMNISVNGVDGVVAWEVNAAFKNQPIQLTCNYLDIHDEGYVENFQINPGETITFAHEVKEIQRVFANLRVKAGTNPEWDIWIPVAIGLVPEITPLAKNKQKNLNTLKEKYYFQGTLPGAKGQTNRVVYFESNKLTDQQAIYSALETNPIDFSKALQPALHDPTFMDYLAEEIYDVIKKEKFRHKNAEKWKTCYESKIDYQNLVKQISSQVNIANINANEIGKYLLESKQESLLELFLKLSADMPEAESFLRNTTLYQDYAYALSKGMLPGKKSVLLYAKLKQRSLSVWQESEISMSQIICSDQHLSHGDVGMHLLWSESGWVGQLQTVGLQNNALLKFSTEKEVTKKIDEFADWELVSEGKLEEGSTFEKGTSGKLEEWEVITENNSYPLTVTTIIANFPMQTVLYIKSMHGFTTPPMLSFLDMSLDRAAVSKNISATGITREGIVVNVTGIPSGLYPYSVGPLKTLSFSIGHGNPVYPSLNYPQSNHAHEHKHVAANAKSSTTALKHPMQHFKYDAWGNTIKETNALGHETTREFNFRNQETVVIQPEVDVTLETGEVIRAKPKTLKGYNERGAAIGITDPKGNTTAFIVNAAKQVMQDILADGSVARLRVYDALSREVRYQDARRAWWTSEYNRKDRKVRFTYPSGLRYQTFGYNELGLCNTSNDAMHRRKYINYDAQGFIEANIDGSQITRFIRDRHGIPELTTYPDHTRTRNKTDYFGVVRFHTDLSNATYTLDYDHKAQLKLSRSTGGRHGKAMELVRDVTINPDGQLEYVKKRKIFDVPNQHKTYVYVAGRLVEEFEENHHKKTVYGYNLAGQIIFKEYHQDRELLRTMRSTLDPLGRESVLFDTAFTMNIGYDLANNRVHIKSEVAKGFGHYKAQERWNTFSPTDNIIINGGKLEGNQIVVGDGYLYSYRAGLRDKELHLGIESTLHYNTDKLLDNVIRSDRKWVNRDYNLANEIIQTDNSDKEIYKFIINNNGWQTGQEYYLDQKLQSSVNYPDMLPRGLPHTQTTTHYIYDHNDLKATIQDKLTHTYANFDEPKISKVGGTRTLTEGHKSKTSNYQSVQLYHNEEGSVTNIVGQQDEGDTNNEYKGNLTNLVVGTDGLILAKEHYTGFMRFRPGGRILYLFTVNGQYLGAYDPQLSEAYLNEMQHVVSDFGGREMGVFGYSGGFNGGTLSNLPLGRNGSLFSRLENLSDSMRNVQRKLFDSIEAFQYADPTASVTKSLYGAKSNSKSGLEFSFPPPMPNSYAVLSGDTPETIAQRMYGSASFTPQIESANFLIGNDSVYTGYNLRLPQAIPSQNKAGTYTPFEQFMGKILGSIYPHLETPQIEHHTSFFETLVTTAVEAIAVVVGVIVAPVLAPFFPAIAAPILAGVTAGLTDIVGQELEIAIGIKDELSWKEVGGVAVSAAAISGSNALWKGSKLASASMLKKGTTAVLQQLGQLALGNTHKFDVKAIAFAMISDKLNENVIDDLQEITSQLTNSVVAPLVMTGRFDLDTAAAQALGNMAGNAIGSQLGNYLASGISSVTKNYLKTKADNELTNAKEEQTPSIGNQANRNRLNNAAKATSKAIGDPHQKQRRFQTNTTKEDKASQRFFDEQWDSALAKNFGKTFEDRAAESLFDSKWSSNGNAWTAFNPQTNVPKTPAKPQERFRNSSQDTSTYRRITQALNIANKASIVPNFQSGLAARFTLSLQWPSEGNALEKGAFIGGFAMGTIGELTMGPAILPLQLVSEGNIREKGAYIAMGALLAIPAAPIILDVAAAAALDIVVEGAVDIVATRAISAAGWFSKVARGVRYAKGKEGGWQSAETALKSMESTQAKNLKRFIDKLPQNSENVRVRDFLDRGKVFQADSPAANIPGSFARYEKQIDSTGNTINYTKTTYGSNGEIVHVAPKFPAGSKIYPEFNTTLQPRLK